MAIHNIIHSIEVLARSVVVGWLDGFKWRLERRQKELEFGCRTESVMVVILLL